VEFFYSLILIINILDNLGIHFRCDKHILVNLKKLKFNY